MKSNTSTSAGKYSLSNPVLQGSGLSNPLLSGTSSLLSSSLTKKSEPSQFTFGSSSLYGAGSSSFLSSKHHGSSPGTGSALRGQSLLSTTTHSSLLSTGTSSLLGSSSNRLGLSTVSGTGSFLKTSVLTSKTKDSGDLKKESVSKTEKSEKKIAGQKRRAHETTKREDNVDAAKREMEKILLGSDTYKPRYEASSSTLPSFDEDTSAWQEKRMRLNPEISVNQDELDLRQWKTTLINKVSCSLIQEPNFKDPSNQAFYEFRALLEEAEEDKKRGEFILKVALYCRQELNIRTTANFLLACAAYQPECRPFLRKYFGKTIVLPSDWIDVAEMYQAFHDDRIKGGALPASLRKAMNDKFKDFDEYQLAKYNKDKTKSKYRKRKMAEKKATRIADAKARKPGRGRRPPPPNPEPLKEEKEENKLRTFTLKQLIRHIHIKEPAPYVMSLLGKKYPDSPETFRNSRLPGNWDSERAGKRMRLPVPETWETQVATRGNKAEVWESLLDHKKLPFMAMLRNIRNLIKAGISEKHHDMVLRRLQDKNQVANSRQFPFRFLSAHEAMNDLQKDFEETQQKLVNQALSRSSRTVYGRGRGRGGFRGVRKPKEKLVEESKYSKITLDRYRKALGESVKIAAKHNVPLVRGHTLVICDVSSTMPCTSFRGMGKPRLVQEVAALMCLMCRQAACEASTLLYYSDPMYVHEWTTSSGGILANALMMVSKATARGFDRPLRNALQQILMKRTHVDNVLFLGTVNPDQSQELGVRDFVTKYRATVNPRLVYFENAYKASTSNEVNMEGELDVIVYGYSEQILRFLAQRGNSQLLEHVDSIDKKYKLDPSPLFPTSEDRYVPPQSMDLSPRIIWHHVTLFVSSTFMDMHGERDILTRFVMPRLREQFFSYNVILDEVDLRWGLHEDQTSNVLQCLRQVLNCNFFIGLLGERYGFCPPDYGWADADEQLRSKLPWLEEYPPGRSITELEIVTGGLRDNPDIGPEKAFFFLRDSNALRNVPKALQPCFTSEDAESKKKLQALKQKLRSSNHDVYEYSANYGGIFEHRPVMRELEEFAARVYAVLYNGIKEDLDCEDLYEGDFDSVQGAQDSFVQLVTQKFIGRVRPVQEIMKAAGLAFGKFLRVSGERGCGKTALMTVLTSRLSQFSSAVISYYMDAMPEVSSIADVVQFLYCSICRKFDLDCDTKALHGSYDKLRRKFVETLEEVGSRGPLTLVLDGLEVLDDKLDAFTLNWLPPVLPKHLRVILSCSKSHALYNASKRSDAIEFLVGPLEVLDKSALVRANLQAFGKSLSEAAFNNQMKFITGKRESSSPLYIAIACEEIRMFSLYEKLDEKLKQMPQSLSQLLSEKISRIEAENGQERVRLALALLSVAKAELSLVDMRILLALHAQYAKSDVMTMKEKISEVAPIPHFHLLKLITSLRFVLEENQRGLLKLNRTHATHLILNRLLGASLAPYRQVAHRLLAALFLHQTTSNNCQRFDLGGFEDALESLPSHLLHGDSIDVLRSIVTNISYVGALTMRHRLKSILEFSRENVTVNRRLQKEWDTLRSSSEYIEILDFVRANLHILQKYPQLLYQQALNAPRTSAIYSAAVAQDHSASSLVTMEVISRESSARKAIPFTQHTDFAASNTALAVSSESGLVAVGNRDGTVLLLKQDTAELVRSLSGHAAAVTCVEFVTDAVLGSGAEDGSISLWDVTLGVRTHFLHDARRQSRVATMTSWDSYLVTMEKDCEMLVINTKDPKQKWTSSFPSVINSLHNNAASGGTVVAGLWNSTILLYNLNTQARVATFRGHKSSVQCVRYSNDAIHIASASLDGEVRLWHTKTGTRIGRFHPEAPSTMTGLHFSPHLLAAASQTGLLHLWSSQLGREISCLGDSSGDSVEKDDPISCVRVHDGLMAIGRHSGRTEVWQCETGRLVDHSSEFHVARLTQLAWGKWNTSRGQETLALMTASMDRTVTVAKVTQSGKFDGILSVFDGDSGVLSLSWEGKFFAFGRDNGSVELMSSQSGSDAVTLNNHNLQVTGMDILARSSLLATVSLDMSIDIYDCVAVSSGDKSLLTKKVSAHNDGITCVSWDRGNQPGSSVIRLCTGANNGEVKVWNLTDPIGTNVRLLSMLTLSAHDAPVSSIYCEAPLIASGSADGTLKVWTENGALASTRQLDGRVSSCQILLPQDLTVSFAWADSEPDIDNTTIDAGEKRRKVAREKTLQAQHKIDRDSAGLVQVFGGTESGTAHILRPFLPESRLVVPLHTAPARGVSIAADRAVTCSEDSSICEVPVDLSVLEGKAKLTVHTSEVTCFASNPEAPIFVTGDSSGVLAIHQRHNTTHVSRILTPDRNPVIAAAIVAVRHGNIKIVISAGLNVLTIMHKTFDDLPFEMDLSDESVAVSLSLTTVTNQCPIASMVLVDKDLICSDWNGGLHEHTKLSIRSMSSRTKSGPSTWITHLMELKKHKQVVGIASDFNTDNGFMCFYSHQFQSDPDPFISNWPSDLGRPTAMAKVPSEDFLLIGTSKGHVILVSMITSDRNKQVMAIDQPDGISALCVLKETRAGDWTSITFAAGCDNGNVSIWRAMNDHDQMMESFGEASRQYNFLEPDEPDDDDDDPPCIRQVGLHMNGIGVTILESINSSTFLLGDKQGNLDYVKLVN